MVPSMREHGGGRIINISSTATQQVYPSAGPYTSTKHALNSLLVAARLELAPDNIRVITVYPHNTASDFIINVETPADADTPEFNLSRKKLWMQMGMNQPTNTWRKPRCLFAVLWLFGRL